MSESHCHTSPSLSIVIPVRNDWTPLGNCLRSLARQTTLPAEVVVVDDGSSFPAPITITAEAWPFLLRVLRRPRVNVAAARNAGISQTAGELLCFVDADMVLEPSFLEELLRLVGEHPDDVAFQPQIVGSPNNLVDRMEDLRLRPTQDALRLPDGHILYFVTGACALRRRFFTDTPQLFDTTVVRGSDTLLFARLVREGRIPRYVPGAIASHRPPHSVPVHILRHFGMGYYTVRARAELAEAGKVVMTTRQRLSSWAQLMALARRSGPDRLAAGLTLLAYSVQVCGRLAGRLQASFAARI